MITWEPDQEIAFYNIDATKKYLKYFYQLSCLSWYILVEPKSYVHIWNF